MKIIYTKIVGDLFHPGHVNFLRAARQRGDKLVVHVVDDERVEIYKRRPVMTQEERLEVVSACKWVDEAVAEGPRMITREFLETKGYTSYAFGFASDTEKEAKMKDCSNLPPEMIEIIPYTHAISTTILIDRVLNRSDTFSTNIDS